MGATIMNASDAMYGSLASCLVKIKDQRFEFMFLTEFESKWEINIAEVPILGKVGMGHKPAGGKGTWSGKAHFNQSHLRKVAEEYQKTGVMPYFEIIVTNEDKSSAAAGQTIVHNDCLIDSVVLAKFQAGEELLEEELSGTFESWNMPVSFHELKGVKP